MRRQPLHRSFLVLFAACSPDTSIVAGAEILCTDGVCPTAYTCEPITQRCAQNERSDITIPQIEAVTLSPTLGKDGTEFTLEIVADEPLLEAPAVSFSGAAGTRAFLPKAGDGTRFIMSYSARAEDGEGEHALAVRLVDEAINVNEVPLDLALVLDLTPPALARAPEVTLTPPTTSPAPEVDALGPGARVRIRCVADELIAPTPAPTLVVPELPMLSFELERLDGAAMDFAAELTSSDALTLSSDELLLSFADLAGNVSALTHTLAAPLTIDTEPPSPPPAAALVHHRAPWGEAASAGEAAASVRAPPGTVLDAPRVVLADADDLDAAVVLAPCPVEEGGFVATLPTVARLPLYVFAVDGAGNVSAGTKVPKEELVVVTARGSPLEISTTTHFAASRTQLTSVPEAPETLALPDAAHVTTSGAGSWELIDGYIEKPSARRFSAMSTDSIRGRAVLFGGASAQASFLADVWEWDGKRWTLIVPSPATGLPSGRERHAMAFDSRAERTLLFGGQSGMSVLGDLWGWSGFDFELLSPADPSGVVAPAPRVSHAMAYDPTRGRLVLFGGVTSSPDGLAPPETWEWDGQSWSRRCDGVTCTGPLARRAHGMAYSAADGGVLLFGGERCDTPACSARVMADDTWLWNGATWQPLGAAAPSGRLGFTLVTDPENDRLVLYGGRPCSPEQVCTTFRDTWMWQNGSWHEHLLHVADHVPRCREHAASAYDTRNHGVLLFSGELTDCGLTDLPPIDDELWLLRQAWEGLELGPDGNRSGPGLRRESAAMAIRPTSQIVLFGGRSAGLVLDDTWIWRGRAWSVGPSGPTGRYEAAAASLPDAGFLFGGRNPVGNLVTSEDLFRLDPSWAVEYSGPTGPTGRAGHAMVSDSSGATPALLMFGGEYPNCDGGGGPLCSTLWQFGGASVGWIERCDGVPGPDVCPDEMPAGRKDHAMANDTARERVVVFGGRGFGGASGPLEACDDGSLSDDEGYCAFDDTWEWDGFDWERIEPNSSLAPPARSSHVMFYDFGLDRVLMFGGTADDPRLWGFDRDGWSIVPSVDPEGDGHPVPRRTAVAVYDNALGNAVLFGGVDGSKNERGDTWLWHSTVRERPSHVGLLDWSHIAELDPWTCATSSCGLERIDVRWEGTATAGKRRQRLASHPMSAGVIENKTTELSDVAAARPITLIVRDRAGGNVGTLNSWCVQSRETSQAMCRTLSTPLTDGGETSDTLDLTGTGLLPFDHTGTVSVDITHFQPQDLVIDLILGETPLPELLIWRHGRWEHIGSVADGAVTCSIDAPEELASAFSGPTRTMGLALAPGGANGLTASSVTSDYVEIVLTLKTAP